MHMHMHMPYNTSCGLLHVHAQQRVQLQACIRKTTMRGPLPCQGEGSVQALSALLAQHHRACSTTERVVE